MATTKEDIRGWINEGRRRGATHLIVVADTWDWEDYPKFFTSGGNSTIHDEVAYQRGQQDTKIMEVYWIEPQADIEAQLNMYRSFTYGPTV